MLLSRCMPFLWPLDIKIKIGTWMLQLRFTRAIACEIPRFMHFELWFDGCVREYKCHTLVGFTCWLIYSNLNHIQASLSVCDSIHCLRKRVASVFWALSKLKGIFVHCDNKKSMAHETKSQRSQLMWAWVLYWHYMGISWSKNAKGL